MPRHDRIAVISDVHGNLSALEAVLADIEARGITRIVNLGDNVGKGPRGREVVDLVRARCEVNILGNWDDLLPDPDLPDRYDALDWWRDQLAPGDGEWLRGLAFSHELLLSGRRVRLFHASPRSVHTRVFFDHDAEQFAGMFTNTDATGHRHEPPEIVGYGDVHDAYYEVDLRRRTLFNAGSVGNSMGDPTPVYTILEGHLQHADDVPAAESPFSIQFVRVPYDVEAELRAAAALGAPMLEEYALEIRDGLYRGLLSSGAEPRYHRPAPGRPPRP